MYDGVYFSYSCKPTVYRLQLYCKQISSDSFSEYVPKSNSLQKNILEKSLRCSRVLITFRQSGFSEEALKIRCTFRKTSLMEATFQYSYTSKIFPYKLTQNWLYHRGFLTWVLQDNYFLNFGDFLMKLQSSNLFLTIGVPEFKILKSRQNP